MIRWSIRMLIPLGRQNEALSILMSASTQTQGKPGCISSRIYRCVDDVNAIMTEEFWTNDEDLLRHLDSDSHRWVILVTEMAEKAPEMWLETIMRSSGVETIEKARITCS